MFFFHITAVTRQGVGEIKTIYNQMGLITTRWDILQPESGIKESDGTIYNHSGTIYNQHTYVQYIYIYV